MMSPRKITGELLAGELVFATSRSGGPGGQNVNKVNSKVILQFNVAESQALTDEEKDTIAKKLSSKINREGILIITAQESRSQLVNKQTAVEKLEALLAKAFEKRRVRKPTKPGKSAVQERIKKKKVLSEKKKWRRRPDL